MVHLLSKVSLNDKPVSVNLIDSNALMLNAFLHKTKTS